MQEKKIPVLLQSPSGFGAAIEDPVVSSSTKQFSQSELQKIWAILKNYLDEVEDDQNAFQSIADDLYEDVDKEDPLSFDEFRCMNRYRNLARVAKQRKKSTEALIKKVKANLRTKQKGKC